MKISQLGELATFFENHEIEGVDKECFQRLSCSKHYYHLFHIVSCWLNAEFSSTLTCAGGATHQSIRTCCELLAEQHNDRNFKKLAMKLKHLHDIRVLADYRLADAFTDFNLQTMRAEKDRAINLIENLDSKYSNRALKQA